MCRKHHGSLFGTGLGVRRESFRWLEGANEIVHYRATAAFERPFCRRCGSTVPAVSQDERYWNVPAGLLDADPGARPRTHIFAASRSPLTELDDELPRHDDYPPGFTLPTAPVRAPQEVAAVGGSCLCGAVVFTASVAPQRLVNCYCSLCRRSRAAAFGSTLLVPGESFRFTRGAHHVRSYALPAAATAMDGGSAANAGAICARRYATDFCGECGRIIKIIFFIKDPITTFKRYLDKNEQLHSDLIKSWNQRYLITQANLEKKITKYLVDINVQYRPNLKDKYCGKFVSCGEYPEHINLLNDLTIINKNQSVILKHNGELVGAVIRDIASKEVFHHFGIKMKLTIDAHYPIKRGKEHVGLGTIVGQGDRKNPLNSKIGKYAYKEKVV
jgi:hypothetical protein